MRWQFPYPSEPGLLKCTNRPRVVCPRICNNPFRSHLRGQVLHSQDDQLSSETLSPQGRVSNEEVQTECAFGQSIPEFLGVGRTQTIELDKANWSSVDLGDAGLVVIDTSRGGHI